MKKPNAPTISKETIVRSIRRMTTIVTVILVALVSAQSFATAQRAEVPSSQETIRVLKDENLLDSLTAAYQAAQYRIHYNGHFAAAGQSEHQARRSCSCGTMAPGFSSELTAGDEAFLDFFGYSVAISGDTAIVGAFQKSSNTGAAYVYVRSGDVWSQQQKLTANDGAPADFFGISVAISSDTAVVGCQFTCCAGVLSAIGANLSGSRQSTANI